MPSSFKLILFLVIWVLAGCAGNRHDSNEPTSAPPTTVFSTPTTLPTLASSTSSTGATSSGTAIATTSQIPPRLMEIKHYSTEAGKWLVVGTTEQSVEASQRVCQSLPSLVNAQDLALSPRSDADAEILALEASGEFVAPQAIYERASRDLKNIRTAYAEQVDNPLCGFPLKICNDAFQCVPGPQRCPIHTYMNQSLSLIFETQGHELIQASNYSYWGCLNSAFQMAVTHSFQTWYDAKTPLRLTGQHLANLYLSLPYVNSAFPNGIVGDGSDICLSIEGERYNYIFDNGSGDCPAGCLSHIYHGFSTNAAGEVTHLGSWEPSNATPNPPQWYTDLAKCRRFL